jgi:hypothetical protein
VKPSSPKASSVQCTNLPDAGHNESVHPFHRVTTLVKRSRCQSGICSPSCLVVIPGHPRKSGILRKRYMVSLRISWNHPRRFRLYLWPGERHQWGSVWRWFWISRVLNRCIKRRNKWTPKIESNCTCLPIDNFKRVTCNAIRKRNFHKWWYKYGLGTVSRRQLH